MLVEAHDRLGKPIVFEATRIVIRDSEYKNPIALAVEYAGGIFAATAKDDADFKQCLRSLGLSQTILVTSAAPQNVEEISFGSIR